MSFTSITTVVGMVGLLLGAGWLLLRRSGTAEDLRTGVLVGLALALGTEALLGCCRSADSDQQQAVLLIEH